MMVVSKAVTEVLNDLSQVEEKKGNEYPSYWKETEKGENLKLVQVEKESELWKKIEERVKETLNVQIEKIEIIQNKQIYHYYLNCKSYIENDCGNANEMQLFHGTRNTEPSKIYQNIKGFDLQFCSSGMWGVASYFSQHASYSHSYRYSLPNQRGNQIFLATVLGIFSSFNFKNKSE